MQDRLRVSVVPQQSLSKIDPTEGGLSESGQAHFLGDQVQKHCQVVVPFGPVHLIDSHSHHTVEAQPSMRRINVGEDQLPLARVAPDVDLIGTLRDQLTHQGYGEGLELLGKVLTAPLRRRCDREDLASVATAFSRQDTSDYALFVVDVTVPPVHRLDMVVANHRGVYPGNLLRLQLGGLFDLKDGRLGACLKPRFHQTPNPPKPQQLSKRFFRCYRPPSSCIGQGVSRFTANSKDT